MGQLQQNLINKQKQSIKFFAEDVLEELDEMYENIESPFEGMVISRCMGVVKRKLTEWGCDSEPR